MSAADPAVLCAVDVKSGADPLTERQEASPEIVPEIASGGLVCEAASERPQLPASRPLPNALKHGMYSQQLQDDAATWRADQVARIRADLGDDVSTLKGHAIDQVGTVLVVLRFLSENLMAIGPLTGKGRQRAALTAYMQTLDRYMRLTQQLGLDRTSKPVTNPADWLEGKA